MSARVVAGSIVAVNALKMQVAALADELEYDERNAAAKGALVTEPVLERVVVAVADFHFL